MDIACMGDSAAGRCLRRPYVTLLLVIAVMLGAVGLAGPAVATAPCGTVLISGGSWLQGQGVDVKSNGTGSCTGGSANIGWQCVDLATRLYQAHPEWGAWVHANAANAEAWSIPEGSTGFNWSGNGSITSIAPGDLIVEKATASNSAGHVTVVDSVDGGVVHAVQQHIQYGGMDYPRRDYTWDGHSLSPGYGAVKSLGHAPKNKLSVIGAGVLEVKRTSDPGGVRQVFAATKSAVTEGWWVPGGDGVHTSEIIRIAQNDIVSFDKVNLPSNRQAVYTAVPDGLWETWWGPGQGLHSSKIVAGLKGVRQVITDNRVENGQLVHRLYLLAQDGPHQIWWRDGGDGVHNDLLNAISGPVTMAHSIGPDGADQLYVATPTWVYELSWSSGGAVHARSVINITQGDIRSLSKGQNLADGGQPLYTGTSTTAWQSYWLNGSSISNGTIAQGQSNALEVQKTVTDGTHQLYLTTGDHVQEYWWGPTGSGSSPIITIAQNNITTSDKYSDGSTQQLYTGAGDTVWETWWRSGVSPTSNVLFHVPLS